VTRRLVSTGSPFERAGGYSRAVVQEPFAFVAGTTGYDYSTMTMPESVEEQTENCFRTISAALAEAGFALEDLVRVQYFVTSREDGERAFPVFGRWLGEIRPAAGLYIVAGLLKPEMRIEVEATAMRRG
jgi:enamine deaminase RidA (YjgF/YER057c/UK114 family)